MSQEAPEQVVWDLVLVHTRHAERRPRLAGRTIGARRHLSVMNHALTVVTVAILVSGVSTLFWTSIGIGRLIQGVFQPPPHKHRRRRPALVQRFGAENVAVLIPAHNEEAVLYDSLMAASVLLPLSQIHVVSDGSSDRTVKIAEEFGVRVMDLQPNRGKAGALAAAIETSTWNGCLVWCCCWTPTPGSPPLPDHRSAVVQTAGRGGRGRASALHAGSGPAHPDGPVPGLLPVPGLCDDSTAGEVRPGRAVGGRGDDRAWASRRCTAPTSCIGSTSPLPAWSSRTST